VGDWTCLAWGIHHGAYHVDAMVPVDALLVASRRRGRCIRLVRLAFAEANHALGGWLKRVIPYGPLRPAIGGVAVIALVWLFGTRDYLGLGTLAATPGDLTIASFFGPDTHPWSWALKLLFTVVTLSAGFKGGEVTPLFFIGAALGNALAPMFGVPTGFSRRSVSSRCSRARPTRRWLARSWGSSCSARPMRCRSQSRASSPISAQATTASTCRSASPRCLPHTSPDATLRDARTRRASPARARLILLPVESSTMPDLFTVQHREVGMLRIYLKPSDKIGPRRFWGQSRSIAS
jgi:hypothetical protein